MYLGTYNTLLRTTANALNAYTYAHHKRKIPAESTTRSVSLFLAFDGSMIKMNRIHFCCLMGIKRESRQNSAIFVLPVPFNATRAPYTRNPQGATGIRFTRAMWRRQVGRDGPYFDLQRAPTVHKSRFRESGVIYRIFFKIRTYENRLL